MKIIHFHLDFISPYAYLAFEALPQALSGIDAQVMYRPVLFAGILKHHGQLGPAEIAPKRDWTYRQVLWQAYPNSVARRVPSGDSIRRAGTSWSTGPSGLGALLALGWLGGSV